MMTRESFYDEAEQANAPRVPLKGKQLRIMPIGDSITAGGMPPMASYRVRLVQHLEGNHIDMVGNSQNGPMKPPKLNRGEFKAGKTIEEITAQVQDSLGKWRPNLILLHIGTNDVAQQKEMDSIGKRIQILVDLLIEKCPDAVIIVAQIIPCCFRGKEVLSYNKQVAQLVMEKAAAGVHILLVDMYEPFEFSGHPNYLADVAHPNQYGHVVLADQWIKAIEKANGLGWITDPVHTE